MCNKEIRNEPTIQCILLLVLVVPDDYCQSVYNVGSNQTYYIWGAGGYPLLSPICSHDVWKYAEMTRQQNLKMLQFQLLPVTASH